MLYVKNMLHQVFEPPGALKALTFRILPDWVKGILDITTFT